MPQNDAPTEQLMQCMEIWGGNQVVFSHVLLPGLDAWVYSVPYGKSQLGGDLHYVSSCATGRITRLLLADVSGHGQSVGRITIALRELMRQYVNYFSQSSFMAAMNHEFTALSKAGVFATAVVTSFYAPTRELQLCNAGHPPPLLYRARTGSWSFLVAQEQDQKQQDNPAADQGVADIPLGLVDETPYTQFNIILDVGDRVLCYTDSLIESNDAAGRMLGTQGLLNLVEQLPVDPCSQFIPNLLSSILKQSSDNLTQDDVSVLLYRTNGQGEVVSLSNRLLAPFRVLRGLLFSFLPGGGKMPWPEMTLRNFGLEFLERTPAGKASDNASDHPRRPS